MSCNPHYNRVITDISFAMQQFFANYISHDISHSSLQRLPTTQAILPLFINLLHLRIALIPGGGIDFVLHRISCQALKIMVEWNKPKKGETLTKVWLPNHSPSADESLQNPGTKTPESQTTGNPFHTMMALHTIQSPNFVNCILFPKPCVCLVVKLNYKQKAHPPPTTNPVKN